MGPYGVELGWRFCVDFESISGRFRVDFGSILERFRNDFGTISDGFRVDFELILVRFPADFGSTSGFTLFGFYSEADCGVERPVCGSSQIVPW